MNLFFVLQTVCHMMLRFVSTARTEAAFESTSFFEMSKWFSEYLCPPVQHTEINRRCEAFIPYSASDRRREGCAASAHSPDRSR